MPKKKSSGSSKKQTPPKKLGMLVVDTQLPVTETGEKELKAAEKKGYEVIYIDLPEDTTLLLSSRASYWHPDLWPLLRAKLKDLNSK